MRVTEQVPSHLCRAGRAGWPRTQPPPLAEIAGGQTEADFGMALPRLTPLWPRKKLGI